MPSTTCASEYNETNQGHSHACCVIFHSTCISLHSYLHLVVFSIVVDRKKCLTFVFYCKCTFWYMFVETQWHDQALLFLGEVALCFRIAEKAMPGRYSLIVDFHSDM